MPIDSAVVLSHPIALATKRFSLESNGKVKTESYGFGKYFEAEIIPLDSLDDIYKLLCVLRDSPRSFVIRGEPIPGRDLKSLPRTKNAKGGEGASFREQPRYWLMLDVDGADIGEVDWGTPAGCADAANRLVGLLPMELRTSGYIWQASASAAQKGGARFHLWYWLDRPLGEHDLSRWGDYVNENAGKKLLDVAVFRTIQPLYVATPLFGDGMLDKVAQRIGYVPGTPAVLPRITGRGEAWKRKLEPLYHEHNEKIHDHVRNASASYFCQNGPDAADEALLKAMRVAVARAEELQNRQGEYPESRLVDEVESGRAFARERGEVGESLLRDSKGEIKNTIGNVIAIMQSHSDWQRLVTWNVRAGRIELLRPTLWGSPKGEWIDARDSVLAARWFVKEKRVGIEDGTILRACTTLAREIEIDPVADWLAELEWDCVPRLDTWMVGWCGAPNTDYVRRVSRIMLIGAVARALQPGCKLDTVTVLQGETGRRKSTLVETLGGEWFASLDDEKDMLQKIHGPWFVELPELGPFRSLNYNRIKSFTSTREDRFRAPYMRLPENRPRRNVLVATVNPEGIGWQEDATSGRRFHPVEVGAIDLEAIKAAREQLFAEAVVAFHAGEMWWVDDPRDPDFVEAQESVYSTDTWEDLIQETLVKGGTKSVSGGRLVTMVAGAPSVRMSDLLALTFDDLQQNRRSQMRASRALMRLGWISSKGGGFWEKKALTEPQIEDTSDVDEEKGGEE